MLSRRECRNHCSRKHDEREEGVNEMLKVEVHIVPSHAAPGKRIRQLPIRAEDLA